MEPAGYLAAHAGAALFDRSERGKIAVAGNDRLTYLHAMFTNDIATLRPGGGCYAAYLTPQGRMIADLRVLEIGDLALLDLEAPLVPAVLGRLDQFIFAEDVKLGDLTQAFGELSVVGPAASRVVASVLTLPPGTADLGSWPEYQSARARHGGETVLLVASQELGRRGFDLFVERAHLPALSGALVESGAVPGGHEAAETLRIEAGRPRFGADLTSETIPLEAGIESRAISLTKGCYPGQEVIIRVLHRGHGRVARKLVGLVVAGPVVPQPGDALTVAEREVGRVTSATWSPLVGEPVALAYLQRDFLEPGTEVIVAHGAARLRARVVALPFQPMGAGA
jgi:folate-binding protein YgfZ